MDTPVATECTPLLQSRDNQHTNTHSVDGALDRIGCGFFLFCSKTIVNNKNTFEMPAVVGHFTSGG